MKITKTAAGIVSLAMLLSTSGLIPAPANAVSGGVVINEVCPKNSSYTIEGGLYDWIELYNSSNSAIDISGWGVSDKETKPYRYTIPEGTSLPAGGRLMIACDSNAAASNTKIAPFGLSTSGETITLTDKTGEKIDSVTFETLADNQSIGRYPDGSNELFTLKSTPASANTAPEGSSAVRTPEFSKESGYYDSQFDLTINVPQGCTVYYTTDGSDPTTDSEKYSSPISISDRSDEPNVYSARTDISADTVKAPKEKVDKAAIIRAVAVDSQGRTSNIITKTYFIGKTNAAMYKNMKVVSLVTDPDNLFDYEKGIYVKGKVYDDTYGTHNDPQNPQDPQNPGGPGGPGGWGGGIGGWGGGIGGWGGFVNPWEMEANYTQHGKEWERPATLEMFEDGKSVLYENVGIRIKGAASRNHAQKSFNIYNRTDYGYKETAFDLFDGKATKKKSGKVIDKFDGFTLRNGGNDNLHTYFRDSINQSLVADRNMATQATSECIVFLDGEFWGIYQIMEKQNDSYLKSRYGINADNAVIIKNGEADEGTDKDLQDWKELTQFCASNNMENDSNYAQVCEKLDIQSYIDYFAAQIYWNNTDWPQNNFAVWRVSEPEADNQYADGKWRALLFDTEYSTGLYGMNTTADIDAIQRIQREDNAECKMFISLLKNKDFSEHFWLTMTDLINYNFSEDKTADAIYYYSDKYRDQILASMKRYSSGNSMFGGSPESEYTSDVNSIINFYTRRPDTIINQMKRLSEYSGSELMNLTVNNDPDMGTLRVNTITLGKDDSRWEAKYLSKQTITLTAEPKKGKQFVSWDVSGIEITDEQMTDPVLVLPMSHDLNITAVYQDAGDALLGDCNSDGIIDWSDVESLNSYILGKKKKISNADMNGDGKINGYDAIILRRMIVGNK